jgi:ABC-type microcin C transport system permease subunit YejB
MRICGSTMSLSLYILRRLLLTIPTLFGISIAAFVISHLVPAIIRLSSRLTAITFTSTSRSCTNI